MAQKKVNFSIITDSSAPYEILASARKWHQELGDADIALAWKHEIPADKDGHVTLGQCVKVSDLQKEFMAQDFVIVLNRERWGLLTPEQQLALIDHELCHATVAEDEYGQPKTDERGRKVYRMRKHDIEEFHAVVERHGLWKKDLEAFAEKASGKSDGPLFSDGAEAGTKEMVN